MISFPGCNPTWELVHRFVFVIFVDTHKSYQVELTVLNDSVVFGATYNVGVANTYSVTFTRGKVVHWREKNINLNCLPHKKSSLVNTCWLVFV